MKKIGVYILLLVMLSSCGSQHSVTKADFDQSITLLPGKPRVVGKDDPISVKVIDIQDNRCPEGVQCVWEGYVSANLEMVGSDHEKALFTLCSGKCEQTGSTTKLNVVLGVKAFEVTLIEVATTGKVTLKVRKI